MLLSSVRLWALRFLVIATGLLLPSAKPADPPLIRFSQLGRGDGLSDARVNDIVQDRYGYIWIGTENGLNRFDGHRFDIFTPDPENAESISHARISDLEEDHQGNLWVATLGGGLNRLDPSTGKAQRFRPNPEISNTIPTDHIQTIVVTHEDVLWLGTKDNGLVEFDPAGKQFRQWHHDPTDSRSPASDTIHTLHIESGRKYWVGTDRGLDLFDAETGIARHIQAGNAEGFSLAGVSVHALMLKNNLLYVGTDKGFAAYNPVTDEVEVLRAGDRVTEIYSQDNRMWLGTRENGLVLWENGRWNAYTASPLSRYALGDNGVRALSVDGSGNLWVGTAVGVSRANIKDTLFDAVVYREDAPDRITGKGVKAVTRSPDGEVWLGSPGEGLTRLNRETGAYKHYRYQPGNPRSLSHNYVEALLFDTRGDLWIGTIRGLNRLRRTGDGFDRFLHRPGNPATLNHNGVTALAEDHRGVLWIGTQEGLNWWEDGRLRRVPSAEERPGGLPPGRVNAICEDQSGNMWIGLTGGLVRYDRREDRFVLESNDVRAPVELRENAVRYLTVHEDTVWIGTWGGGLICRNPDGSYKGWQMRQGLPSDMVCAILVQKADLVWASTPKGVVSLYPRFSMIVPYDLYDGLQADRFLSGAAYKSKDGEFFFGGVKGFNSFYPEKGVPRGEIPQIVISGLNAEGAEPFYHLSDGSEITLPEGTESFTIDFAAMDFTRPEKNNYRWYLEPLEEDWGNPGTRHRATYSDLAPGSYTFKVSGSNAAGVWNIKGSTVKIEIAPSFMMRWGRWIYIGGGIVLLMMVSMGFLTYHSSHQAHLAELRRKEQVAVEANRSKNAFLAHMSHELRTPLNAILGFSEILEEDIEEYDPAVFQPKQFLADLHKIKSNAYLQLTQVNNLLELTRLESGKSELYVEDFEIRTMIGSVLHHIEPMLEKTGNRLELIYRPADIGNMTADSLKLQNILINLLTNANKFTRDGLITLTIVRDHGEIIFRVQDTGVGISGDKLRHLFEALPMEGMDNTHEGNGLGLYISNQFSKMMGGRISAESKVSRGSTFSVTLPSEFTKTKSSGGIIHTPSGN
ncbi:MAG: two-component regulator propeller domain-containing protein [Acidobacteriota bacterium]|nr:two-component regulator propeller domain-containing protein [Acidobacteriota bacterium]